MLLISCGVYAQEPPPRPPVVTETQNLAFGAFTLGAAGGTITINAVGSRSATGDIILLGMGYMFTAARYEVVANPGTLIGLLHDPGGFVLTGTPSGSMTVYSGDSDPVSPFVVTTTPPNYTPIYVGGTLNVGNLLSNPAGSYTGTFDITFVQE